MRKLALFAAAFGAAALLSCYCVPLNWLVVLGMGCGLGAGLIWLALRERGRRPVLLLAGLAAGFMWFRGWTDIRLAPVEELAGTTAGIRALVTGYSVPTGYGERAEVEIAGLSALLYTDGETVGLCPGDEISVTADLKRVDLRRGEKTASFTSRGCFLLAYAKGALKVERPDRIPLRLRPAVWAQGLEEGMKALFPADAGGLITAVLLGDKTGLDQGAASALSRAGLSHATAVSGLHVGFLTQLLLLLCRKRRLAAGLAIPVLAVFALVTGASPGTVRAVVMQAVLLLAPLFRRENDAPTSLGFALLLILIWNPYAAASVSLQLSFAAVAGMLLMTRPVMERLGPLYTWAAQRGWRRLLGGVSRFLCGVLAATLGAMLFTAPLSALYFGSVSLAGVLANLLALWAVTGVFVFGLLAALAGQFLPVLGTLLGFPALLCARWVLWVAKGLSALGLAALPMDLPYCRLWLGSVYGLMGLCFLLRKYRPEPLIPLAGSLLLLAAALGLARADYTGPALTVTALNVGQGSSTVFLSGGKTVLVDCGGNRLQNAGDTAADWLQALGRPRVDLLVLTHFDTDHFNGVEELFRRMEVSAVAIPLLEEDPQGKRAALYGWAEAAGAEVTAVSALTRVEAGDAVFTLYPPLGRGTSNEEGLSVLCSLGEWDALVTGDADEAIEGMLVKYFDLPDLELLVAGHHGSKHSTSPAFLAAVAPDTVIISSGENAYGHPAPETLARLEAAGAAVCRTDTLGTVTLTVSGK